MPRAVRFIARGERLRPIFAIAGILTLVLLAAQLGDEGLYRVLARSYPWIGAIVAVELVRVALDAAATRASYGSRRDDIPTTNLIRAELIGQAVGSLAPAGRAAAEASKSALLAPWTGAGAATSAAFIMQSASLVSTGLISIPCAVAAATLGGPAGALALPLLLLSAVFIGAGTALRWASRRRYAAKLLGRLPLLGDTPDDLQAAAREGRLLPLPPVTLLTLSRVLQVGQYALMIYAVKGAVTVHSSLIAQSINILALLVGALVPGQVGVSDGAFVLMRSSLEATAAQAMVIALLAHALQVIFIPVGIVVPYVWRTGQPPKRDLICAPSPPPESRAG